MPSASLMIGLCKSVGQHTYNIYLQSQQSCSSRRTCTDISAVHSRLLRPRI